jgi:hypothetical protein
MPLSLALLQCGDLQVGAGVVHDGSSEGADEGSGCEVDLAGTTTGALAGDDDAGHDQLAAPDPPRLTPLEGTGEARLAQRTGDAEGLGVLDGLGRLGEPQVGVLVPAGQNRA